ncbi:hypothetical protein HELRODRAFT_167441 [Helobdella robusta]|uniref:Uncharacterized protein n=1 Tax=Helobdella robusta TaxID=6412 RepID=T1EZD9_HELRO|nr:hypothetical protein HELRODRAFT_167441 [Helobdella robusta]ESO10926.1 hypothetical protein HELRODRAFT_167441 [Helobdella robusta]
MITLDVFVNDETFLELSFSMSYLRSAERLTVTVGLLKAAKKNIKASTFNNFDFKNLLDVYVKAVIFENEKKMKKRKTSTLAVSSSNANSCNNNTISVDWQESLFFDIPKDKLQSGQISLEMTLYGSEHFFIPAYSLLGSIKFGPKDPLDPEIYAYKKSISAVYEKEKFEGDSEEEREVESAWWETILSEKYQSYLEFYRLQ